MITILLIAGLFWGFIGYIFSDSITTGIVAGITALVTMGFYLSLIRINPMNRR